MNLGSIPLLKFQVGSCAVKMWPFYYFSFKIFKTMNSRKADFNIWLGDHLYMLKPWQWDSKANMIEAYHNQRKELRLAKFMKNTRQYAIWDDHDYGPNNSDSTFEHKAMAREVFMKMWKHPQYGENNEGIYYTFTQPESQFFMLDCRYFKLGDKKLLGNTQLEWLKKELVISTAKFKFICFSIQVLCDGGYENFRKTSAEFSDFMSFLSKNKIKGVVFFSGDVHYTEISKLERPNEYSLYDFTYSPLTSFPGYYKDNLYSEISSRYRKNNFGEVVILKENEELKCVFKCIDSNGVTIWEKILSEKELGY